MLQDIGIKYGTDKVGHGYLPHYEQHFSKFAGCGENVLEIGVHMCASLYMWNDFFGNCTIHGIDNVPQKKEYETDCIRIHIGDQTSSEFLINIGKEIQPLAIVIDDGGHTMRQQIVSLFELFPFVRSGGLYAIEDLHTSYHEEFYGNSEMTTMQYLKGVIDDLMYHGKHYNGLVTKKSIDIANYYETHIAAMHFYRSLVIIEKK